MPITKREMTDTPIIAGSKSYTLVAGDIAAHWRVPGGELRAGYARPLRIEIENGQNRRIMRIPDRQLEIIVALALIVAMARLTGRRRRL